MMTFDDDLELAAALPPLEITNAPKNTKVSLELLLGADPRFVQYDHLNGGRLIFMSSPVVTYRLTEWLPDESAFAIERVDGPEKE